MFINLSVSFLTEVGPVPKSTINALYKKNKKFVIVAYQIESKLTNKKVKILLTSNRSKIGCFCSSVIFFQLETCNGANFFTATPSSVIKADAYFPIGQPSFLRNITGILPFSFMYL